MSIFVKLAFLWGIPVIKTVIDLGVNLIRILSYIAYSIFEYPRPGDIHASKAESARVVLVFKGSYLIYLISSNQSRKDGLSYRNRELGIVYSMIPLCGP